MTEPGRGNLIVFAGALYDAPLWTNRQHIAHRLAQRGWRVLYVEPRLFFLRSLFGRLNGSGGRLRWFLRHFIPWHAEENLWVISQMNLIPGSRRWPFLGRLNHLLFNLSAVRLHAHWLQVRDPVLLLYDTEAAEFLNDFPNSRVVYDCVDDHRAQAGVDQNPGLTEQEERALSVRASAVAVTTLPLFERFAAVHPFVRLVPNAADIQAFLPFPTAEPEDMAAIPHPRIGMVGALDAYKVDFDLLASLARQQPGWQFVLIGPVDYVNSEQWAPHFVPPLGGTSQGRVGRGQSVAVLRPYPNIHFLGWKSRGDVPAYVHAFDVAIIPYRASPYNRSSFPLKFWEFLAAGKPLVASGLPSLEPYRHLVTLATTSESFTEGIARALAFPEQGRSERVTEARKHDWSARVAQIEQLLQGGVR